MATPCHTPMYGLQSCAAPVERKASRSQVKQSKRMPFWMRYIIAKLVGVKTTKNDKPIIGMAVFHGMSRDQLLYLPGGRPTPGRLLGGHGVGHPEGVEWTLAILSWTPPPYDTALIIGTIFFSLTITLGLIYVSTHVLFLSFNAESKKTALTTIEATLQILNCLFGAALGIYANRLAVKVEF
jgi:hypothetical protein